MKIEIEISDKTVTEIIKTSIEIFIDELTYNYEVENFDQIVNKKQIIARVLEKREKCEEIIAKFLKDFNDDDSLSEIWYDYNSGELDKIIKSLVDVKALKKALKEQEQLDKIKETRSRLNLFRKELDQAGYKIVKK